MEALTVLTIASAIGGATSKVVEKVWDSGEKWLSEYYINHNDNVRRRAEQNSLHFIKDLAKRVKILEERTGVNFTNIQNVLNDPDFSALLHETIISSARTESKEKHKLLARIVSTRISSESESLEALTSTMACQAIKHLTPSQLKILGFITLVYDIRPGKEITAEEYVDGLKEYFSLFFPITIKPLDFLHLETTSCAIRFIHPPRYEDIMMNAPITGDRSLITDFITKDELGKQFYVLWSNGIAKVLPSTTGKIIGMHVFDEITGMSTNVSW